MKTALQELVKWLEGYNELSHNNSEHPNIKKGVEYKAKSEVIMTILNRINTNYIKKEKQQIIDAYWGGLNGCINDYSESKTVGNELTGIKIGEGAEFYYNQTYKQDE